MNTRRFRVSSTTAQKAGKTEADPEYWHYVTLAYLEDDRMVPTCTCTGNAEYHLHCSHIKLAEQYVLEHPVKWEPVFQPQPGSPAELMVGIDIDAFLHGDPIQFHGAAQADHEHGDDLVEPADSKTEFICDNDIDPCQNFGRPVHNMLYDH